MNTIQSAPATGFVMTDRGKIPVCTGRPMEDGVHARDNDESYELLIQAAIIQACTEYCEAWVEWQLHPGIKEYKDRYLDALAYFYTDDFELLCDLDPGYLLNRLDRKAAARLAKRQAGLWQENGNAAEHDGAAPTATEPAAAEPAAAAPTAEHDGTAPTAAYRNGTEA